MTAPVQRTTSDFRPGIHRGGGAEVSEKSASSARRKSGGSRAEVAKERKKSIPRPVSTPAKDARCRRCRARILVATDEGIPVRADPGPAAVDHQGLTYVRTARGYLTWLDPDQRPPPEGTRHAEHQCRAVARPEPLTLF